MKFKKTAALMVTLGLSATALFGCSTGNDNSSSNKTEEGVTTIEFWAAPNPTQQAFWADMAKEFEKENSDIKVNVSAIKESPTSEASIQSAIAAKQAPTMSENINRGFGALLAESQAIVPLNEIEGFDELVSTRQMTDTIESWKSGDGSQYIFPIYSNSMLFGWRLDILNELGYEEAPKTYSEVLDVAQKLKEKYPDKYVWAKPDLADPTAWKRWFDFFMLYDAASDGNAFVQGNEFVGDKEAGIKVFEFVQNLVNEDAILTAQVTDPFEEGTGIFTDVGPWTPGSTWKEKYPELVYGETYTLSLPPVPDDMDPENAKTFADAKGVVVYASATEEEQKAALEFLTWVYSNPEADLKWLEVTDLPPARDDLGTNEAFASYFEEKPVMKAYADAVANGVPPMENSKYNEIQTFIGQYAFNKIVKGEIDPAQAWDDMVNAIEGELK
ncbi:sugar ABC transporter substrate-binding protein [Bacillus sp. REN16]|uniref:sugar ABC transporter substrate-binding protein n=1 Tax=Bacillus sp. REN16 TaxID=2887296 RepID=UPI001E51080E|nr:ABC transporter substrate-binding protein [Bacillus sp. REN16]MCC3356836.1 ABC transporter substrate-binding protein [Bacillus sp. REN16]